MKKILNSILTLIVFVGLFACSNEEVLTTQPQSVYSIDKEKFIKAFAEAYKNEAGKHGFCKDTGNGSPLFVCKQ